jgi:hypothetical protein
MIVNPVNVVLVLGVSYIGILRPHDIMENLVNPRIAPCFDSRTVALGSTWLAGLVPGTGW